MLKKMRSSLLKDKYPELIYEIDVNKNSHIDIDTLLCNSQEKIFWRCSNSLCGCHIWKSRVYTRLREKGMPILYRIQDM